MKQKISLFWFRRDLRLTDNVGFFHALQSDFPVVPIFIFDPTILDQLPKNDARVSFIFETLTELKKQLHKYNSSLAIYYNDPEKVFTLLLEHYDVMHVYTNHDYEPYAKQRDLNIQTILEKKHIPFHTYKDQVIFEKDEILKPNGEPYVVYTPYKNKWKDTFNPSLLEAFPSEDYLYHCIQNTELPTVSLTTMGFHESTIKVPAYNTSTSLIDNYEETRNYPAQQQGTSKLGTYLRFGNVSIRTIMKKAIASKNQIFWSELIWREFFMHILWHFPHTQHNAFKPKYDRIEWRNNEVEFEAWKKGETGYPFVDAGMRELNTTGYMHNRVRMIVASFLCKHLLIDWRWGEAYFAEKLLDYDMSANIGNWQWAAGSGVDAAPYFRIFNPTTQITKFDKQHAYIHKWVLDINELTYATPIVDHKIARERCLETYKKALQ